MTQKEYEQACEIERLKKENKELRLKNKNLEIEKKTFKMKLKLQSEQYQDLEKENKTFFYKNKYQLEKEKVAELERKIEELEKYIANTRDQLNKNSSNSSKPSSTDGVYKKKCIHSSREKTEKRQGAQCGHEYHSSKLIEKPTQIIKIKKRRKCTCGGKIKYEKEILKRQLIDIENKLKVLEYQGQVGKCEKCGKIYKPEFPKEISKRVQFGNGIKGLSLILGEYGNVPVDKTSTIIGALCQDVAPCAGSIMNWKKELYSHTGVIMEDLKEEILKSPIINSDETPYRENGKVRYAIGAFTPKISVIQSPGGRSTKDFEKINIFERYAGTIVGDHYALNESFKGQTAYCNIHTIRTAKGVLDIRKDSKAQEYIDYILKIKKEVEENPKNKLSKKRYKEVKKEYTELLEEWKKEFNKFIVKNKESKEKYDDERKLINLLLKYIEGHLLFAKEEEVPFTNNDAERGLRLIKSKLKVIGCFRSLYYANGYCEAISIIQTAQKNGLNPCEILGRIISGERNVFNFQVA